MAGNQITYPIENDHLPTRTYVGAYTRNFFDSIELKFHLKNRIAVSNYFNWELYLVLGILRNFRKVHK